MSSDLLKPLADAARWRLFGADELIAAVGDDTDSAFAIAAGAAGLFLGFWEKRAIALVLRAVQIVDLAEAAADLADDLQLKATRQDTLAYQMPRSLFRKQIFSSAKAAEQLWVQENHRSLELVALLGDFECFDPITRLAHRLGRLALDDGIALLDYTHKELALMCRKDRADVTRQLKPLREWALVASEHHSHGIEVLDVGGLLHFRGLTPAR